MKRIIFAATLIAASVLNAQAQFNYTFSRLLNQTYSPLSGATNLTQSIVWDSDFMTQIPLPFSYSINGASAQSSIGFLGTLLLSNSPNNPISGFSALGLELMDRSVVPGLPKSDILYQTTGTTGSRIFKLEIANAGFVDEFGTTNTLNGTVSYQVWLYEGSGITEFHFGPSNVPDFSVFGGPVLSGFFSDLDTVIGTLDKIYTINGNPSTGGVDSFTFISSINKGLSSLPANGTVYRFVPNSVVTQVKGITRVGTLIYPTLCDDVLYIEKNDSFTYDVISLTGQPVQHGASDTGRMKLDLSELVSGQYIIRLSDKSGFVEIHRVTKR